MQYVTAYYRLYTHCLCVVMRKLLVFHFHVRFMLQTYSIYIYMTDNDSNILWCLLLAKIKQASMYNFICILYTV